ncbi:GTP cyclohydrolase II RibA [Amycolatopsis vancoresmycina]|uniref:GTP cyclohydrolase II/3,4-dihydroxy 2-butanone 4-phosphate synthase n=1 Tax=Amycolatopsis vancoresmycina DSM 44592 TaxID=1292037 RepID=R1G444_9PSEU|nr:GTP cyclohydrolase II RibA [Amycolatopsis vancoresmycina]EOD66263.1 GTP cyclohydrolase II/3,4-dihydroxy 2-butanone 4-phosphate synthase [Amycolatopsis vancoresmycina DSM 44592]
MTEVVEHRLQDADGDFRIVVLDGSELPTPACAAVFGDPQDGCLVRIQSRCLYGEIFGSVNCDCRYQLDKSIEAIKQHSGVLIYLDQEGRGAGLLTKARGYRICQDTGVDTFAAYAALECKADSRSYADAVALLKQLGLREITLLTNNPGKLAGLDVGGLKVRHRPLVMPEPGAHTLAYLVAKRDNQEHMLSVAARLRWRVIRFAGSRWFSRRRAALRKAAAGPTQPASAEKAAA